jgi:uncharacterized RDD family membrane protein YckC
MDAIKARLTRTRVAVCLVAETTPDTLGGMATPTGPNPDVLGLATTEVASFGRRIAALLVDWVLCSLVGSLVVDSLRTNPWPPLGVLVLAHAFFVGLFGQTPGMALARIRGVSITDGGVIGIPRAFLRAVLLALAVPAMITDGDGRGLHDRAARSMMLRS